LKRQAYDHQSEKLSAAILHNQAQLNAMLHLKLRQRLPHLQSLKGLHADKERNRMIALTQVLSAVLFRAQTAAFASIKTASVAYIKNSADLENRLEVCDEEKEILEEELQQQLAYYENLQIQLHHIKNVYCDSCDVSMRLQL
jgi:hypothetical protein